MYLQASTLATLYDKPDLFLLNVFCMSICIMNHMCPPQASIYVDYTDWYVFENLQ